jgi:aerobic-type carbon monoxide dehydrogenase small subunit (CoxS/CutS family)
MPEIFTIDFDGEQVSVTDGQTIAAALIAAGHTGWRQTRVRGERRGLFCGIGVCFDCLVTVNETRSLRACLVTAMRGDVVTTERGVERDDLIV